MKKAMLRKLRAEAEKGELKVELPKPKFAKEIKIPKVSKKKAK